MNIRKAKKEDLNIIMSIFETAKEFMHTNGNPCQWTNGYPSEEVVLKDIESNNFYVMEEENIFAVFAFIIGEEINYQAIYNGEWLNNKKYGTIHRIASDFTHKNVFKNAFNFCSNKIDNIKCDTHIDNKPMQNVMLKYGFKKCGIIHLQNGEERIAFQYSKNN